MIFLKALFIGIFLSISAQATDCIMTVFDSNNNIVTYLNVITRPDRAGISLKKRTFSFSPAQPLYFNLHYQNRGQYDEFWMSIGPHVEQGSPPMLEQKPFLVFRDQAFIFTTDKIKFMFLCSGTPLGLSTRVIHSSDTLATVNFPLEEGRSDSRFFSPEDSRRIDIPPAPARQIKEPPSEPPASPFLIFSPTSASSLEGDWDSSPFLPIEEAFTSNADKIHSPYEYDYNSDAHVSDSGIPPLESPEKLRSNRLSPEYANPGTETISPEPSTIAPPQTAIQRQPRRGKVVFSEAILKILNTVFNKYRFPTPTQKDYLAEKTGLTMTQIERWFSNKRKRTSLAE